MPPSLSRNSKVSDLIEDILIPLQQLKRKRPSSPGVKVTDLSPAPPSPTQNKLQKMESRRGGRRTPSSGFKKSQAVSSP